MLNKERLDHNDGILYKEYLNEGIDFRFNEYTGEIEEFYLENEGFGVAIMLVSSEDDFRTIFENTIKNWAEYETGKGNYEWDEAFFKKDLIRELDEFLEYYSSEELAEKLLERVEYYCNWVTPKEDVEEEFKEDITINFQETWKEFSKEYREIEELER